jgi:hypothetical protein
VGKIDIGRVLIVGLIISLVTDIVLLILSVWLLASPWNDWLHALNRPPLGTAGATAVMLWGILVGFCAAWIYAGFRPRFGPGPLTAACAGVTVWAAAALAPVTLLAVIAGLPAGLAAASAAAALVDLVIATIVGMHAYREE